MQEKQFCECPKPMPSTPPGMDTALFVCDFCGKEVRLQDVELPEEFTL